MFEIILLYFIFSGIFGRSGRRALRNMIDLVIFFYGVAFILRIGFGILPLIIVAAAFSRIVIPFARGFFDSLAI